MKDNHIFPFLWMRGEAPEVLRMEMEKIYEAGIRAVCLESRPHPDYAGEGWWHDVDIIIEEARKRDMQIWILDDAHFPTGMANDGMKKHPEKARRWLYTNFVDVTGPVPQVQVDVELLLTKQFTWMDFGKPVVTPLMEETRLMSVTATRLYENDTIQGEVLDLTDHVKAGCLTADIPEGVWRINVNFATTGIGPKTEYINYIEADSVRVLIDEVYEKHYDRYRNLFGTVIAGFFSDEPGLYNTDTYDEFSYLGLKMPLPWGKEMEETMVSRYGKDFYKDITLLYSDEQSGAHRRIRSTYMDVVSTLYGKNFTSQLGDWCRKHNVEYIGHIVEDNCGYMRLGAGIGHYFRAMKGQDMAGIDNIGYQLMPGNDVGTRHTGFQDLEPEFYHYELGKLGSSAAAIDPAKKGRTMCENFGAYGWRLGVRDMKWLVDYLVSQGVNYFVPHAFSMQDYPDVDCPPHFYARGNNPQFPYFCKLMKYTDRICTLFSGGASVSQAAVLFEAEADWAGKTMRGSAVGKELMQHQLDFTILPADVFADPDYYGCEEQDGKLIVNHREMQVLIVPECEFLAAEAAHFIAEHSALPVIFVNNLPIGIAGDAENPQELLAAAVFGRECVALKELSAKLAGMGIRDSVYPATANPNLHQYHYIKNGKDYWMLMNVSLSQKVEVSVHVPAGRRYGLYDAMTKKTVEANVADGRFLLELDPYGSVILVSDPETAEKEQKGEAYETIPLTSFELTLKEIGNPEDRTVSDFTPAAVSSIYRDFSGVMIYRTSFDIQELPKKALFSAQYVYENMTVTVNGVVAGFRITPPYSLDISGALKNGRNEIEISVASTALRNANTKPGIFGRERTVIEPTGMFGEIGVTLCKNVRRREEHEN